jgi:hypothetical protein
MARTRRADLAAIRAAFDRYIETADERILNTHLLWHIRAHLYRLAAMRRSAPRRRAR